MAKVTHNAYGKKISDSSDLIYGTGFSDHIDGKGGADLIYAKGGDDYVIGGAGQDRMNGGWGNDTFFFGRGHNADKIEDFGRDIPGGNNDVIALDQSIDTYFVFAESAGIRIVTVDDGVKQGSITLLGVDADEWASWGGNTDYGVAHSGDIRGANNTLLIDFNAMLIA